MATIETAIWQALKGRVLALSTNPALPIDWPKGEFTPPQAGEVLQPYLEVRHMVNRSARPFNGSTDPEYRMGILQLSVMYPTASHVAGEVDIELAGKIAEHFPADLPLYFEPVTVKIEKRPDIGQGMRDAAQPTYWRTPVSVRWYSFS